MEIEREGGLKGTYTNNIQREWSWHALPGVIMYIQPSNI
jgi:hypothetical protein